MKLIDKARRKVGFRVFGDDEEEYYEDEFYLDMVGDVVELHDKRSRRQKRRERKREKPAFGFARALNE